MGDTFHPLTAANMKLSYLSLFLLLMVIPMTTSLQENHHSATRVLRAATGNVDTTKQEEQLLINNIDCLELKALCSHIHPTYDNLSILECIYTLQASQLEALPNKCQHSIWTHTRELLTSSKLAPLVEKHCSNHVEDFGECAKTENYLRCLKERVQRFDYTDSCTKFFTQLHEILFADYESLDDYFKGCDNEIQQLHCGRLNVERKIYSQLETVACLQESPNSLDEACKTAISKIRQQQTDMQFFEICAEDLHRFCVDERAGTSGAFKCLIKNKNNLAFTRRCIEQIILRGKQIAHDYKASKGLAKSCKDDIRINHCRRGVSEDKNVRLAQILLCLESVSKNRTKLTEECRAEIDDHRKMLMMDYQLSPEILTGCADDIPKFCTDIDKLQNTAGGEVIHCLMDHARSKRRKDHRVTSTCQRAIEQLIKTSDVGEDWRIDPVLRRACKPVVDFACSDTDGGEARVISCLMERIGTSIMTPDCEQSLLLIQYFIARDFKLDPQLYRFCKDDAVTYCHAKKVWDDGANAGTDPERGPLILPCLHRIAYSEDKTIELKNECFKEVKRVMRQRAISVDLLPEIEDACLDDLSLYCAKQTGKGAEIYCLQINLEKLQPNCKNAITSFTEEEAAHVELNPIIMTVCAEAMKNHCDHILKSSKDEGDMMDCLISHKNDADLRQDLKCRAAIEHFQIISLKNYHFTYAFKVACRPHVARYCANRKTKNEVVECLSEVMRNDTIRSQRHSIPKECRQQVKSQLYNQHESLDLDPKLANACKKEISEYCNDQRGPGQAIECLTANTGRLGSACRHATFMLKKTELGDSATDYTLVNACKDMTYKFCPDADSLHLLDCLKLHKDHPMFESHCHLVVVNRMIEQSTDFRFNPVLQLACGKNIDQYCSQTVASAKANEELNGKVIECLKVKFREGRLETKCEQKMIQILQEQALNYKLNPLLKNFCKFEIDVLCKPHIDSEEHGLMEECLKTAFLNQQIVNRDCKIEVATLIAEAKADIHVDPILEDACTSDLLRYCSNVKSGNGRKLKCLQVILQDQSRAMEDDCKNKLRKRIEMFRNADTVLSQPPENMEQLMMQVTASPARKYFLVTLLSCLGMVFIMGMFLGRISKRDLQIKNK